MFSGGFFSGWERGRGGGVTWDDLSMENLSWGKRNSMKGAQDFLAFFKNKIKKNEKVLATGYTEQH